MKKKIWVHKAKSFKDAEEFDLVYRKALSRRERLDDMQLIREAYYKISKKAGDARRKGLQRVIRIIQQA